MKVPLKIEFTEEQKHEIEEELSFLSSVDKEIKLLGLQLIVNSDWLKTIPSNAVFYEINKYVNVRTRLKKCFNLFLKYHNSYNNYTIRMSRHAQFIIEHHILNNQLYKG